MLRKIGIVVITCLGAIASLAQADMGHRLWYSKPAKEWSAEALPIGNGRMGAMFFGGVEQERIQFNEQSLWSGDNNWDGEYELGDHGFGSYQNFGELLISFDRSGAISSYSRSLDIDKGIHTTTFMQDGVRFTREGFASHPNQVMAFSYSASKKGILSGKIMLVGGQKGGAVKASKGEVQLLGEMANNLKYAAIVKVVAEGGSVKADGGSVVFQGCSKLTLLLDARTSYKPDYASNWRGADPLPLVKKEIDNAQRLGYDILKKNHLKDIISLLSRASIDVGTTAANVACLPTDERLKAYGAGGLDPDLEEMMFYYGRYLLVSSSRKGGLPANLQGLWNDSNEPAWASDYHNNINVQMNYWAAETTNLSECHVPLLDFVVAAQQPCRNATRKAFGDKTRGWTARTSQNIFGGNGWEWNIPASAWYAQHFYEHWAFTLDREYLRKVAYPVIKEICHYWEDQLKSLPNGMLVVPNGWSPEHGPREDGVMMDQQIVWDLFQNYLDIARVLNADADYQAKIADMQARLAPNKVGKWGQLQEWQEDRDDPNDQHRHTSHLFAVYPGRQIGLTKTPDLAKAAVISLRSRSGNYGSNENTPFTVESTVGDSRRSWTWPWRCALWARLGEGEKAAVMVRGLLKYNTLSNLFCSHPPFQLDGNFGIPAAITEMLLQSHEGAIVLLPAIPQLWAKEGNFKGLKARGGFTVDCSWKDGKVTRYAVTSAKAQKVKVRVNGQVKEITSIGK